MEATAPRIIPAPDQQPIAALRRRIFQLHRLVWEFTWEKMRTAALPELAERVGFEPVGPLDALRVCGHFLRQIEPMGIFDPILFRLDGVDGKQYLLGFDPRNDGLRVFASRGRTQTLSLVDERPGGQGDDNWIFHEESGSFEEVVLPAASADRAFLVGMSLVIGLMEPLDADDDEQLLPLLQAIAPSSSELAAIAAAHPSPDVQLDDDDPI